MGRKAVILGNVLDIYGDRWDVREFRDTDHGWPLAIGWPTAVPRGRGGPGGPRVILTAELVRHLESVRYELRPMVAAAIPLGKTGTKRLRKLLGHDRKADRHAWWVEHAEELATVPFTEFAAKHGVTASAAEWMHIELFGQRRGRPSPWWSAPDVADLLTSGLPTVAIADQLGRSCQEVWGARYLLKNSQAEERDR